MYQNYNNKSNNIFTIYFFNKFEKKQYYLTFGNFQHYPQTFHNNKESFNQDSLTNNHLDYRNPWKN